MKDFLDMYEYTRGKTWLVQCVLYDTGHITFGKLTAPENASLELREAFLNEAEHAVKKFKADADRKAYGSN